MPIKAEQALPRDNNGAASGDRRGSISTVGYLLVVIFAWGGNYTWTKLGLENAGPWTFNALRYGLALVILVVVLGIRDPRSLLPVRGERLGLGLIGFLQIAVMTGATTFAMTMIEASRTVLIAYSMPIWGMALGFFVLGERVSAMMVVGLALGLSGLVLLCAPWAMDWTSQGAVMGSLIALGGTLAWALASVLYRRRRWKSSFWSQIFGQLAAATITLIPVGSWLEVQPTHLTPGLGVIIAWNAIVPTLLAFYCWARALDRVPVAKASQLLLLSPVLGVALSALVLGEPVTASLLVSGGLIIAGALLSYWPARSRAANSGLQRSPPSWENR